MSVSSQRDAARILRYRLTGVIVTPVVCAYARESVACRPYVKHWAPTAANARAGVPVRHGDWSAMVSTSIPREGS